ncbi:V-set and immunoglobulin domain-containing protein 10-like [Merluccius polli]|nr:V-set and immunoglobulin domain-containing protein 10-like [Merluccius polli]
MWLKQATYHRGHTAMVVLLALMVTLKGADGQRGVSPSGAPTATRPVVAEAGGNVTLAVPPGGAAGSVVWWSVGALPLVTWTFGSDAAPVVAHGRADVLALEEDGSLSFVRVPLAYSDRYTVKIVTPGMDVVQTEFTLKVYERLQNASITPHPALAVEGLEVFSLRSSVQRGEVESRRWFLEEEELRSTSSHYSLQEEQLLIHQLRRGDAGRYSLQLLNPLISYRIDFKVLLLVYKSLNGLGPEYMNDILVEYKPSRALRSTDLGQIVKPRVQTKHGEAAFSCYAAQHWNKLPAELKSAPTVSIFKSKLKTLLFSYGPDEPILEVLPTLHFYESGDSVHLSCRAEGLPVPSAVWLFGGEVLPGSQQGVLKLTNVVVAQGGTYTCRLRNKLSGALRTKNITLLIYERPLGDPECSVHATISNDLQYRCRWPGGAPKPSLAFPRISNDRVAAGDLNLTLAPSGDLDWKTIVCHAQHPLLNSSCNVTARQPADFLPRVGVGVGLDGRIAVTIACLSNAVPNAVVTWLRGGQAVTSSDQHQISANTTQLTVRHFNISEYLRDQFTCTCSNPLGRRTRTTQLLGPSISDSSLVPNQEGTAATLTWEVPPLSLVTGFDIQMKGPALDQNISRSSEFHSIQVKPGSARSAGVLNLDPKSTYYFKVIPSAGRTAGEPSKQHRIGPGNGLSGAAIAGIAAGIPCSILALCIFATLLYLSISYCKNKGQPRYPVSRAVEKVVASQPDSALPDYNKLHVSSQMITSSSLSFLSNYHMIQEVFGPRAEMSVSMFSGFFFHLTVEYNTSQSATCMPGAGSAASRRVETGEPAPGTASSLSPTGSILGPTGSSLSPTSSSLDPTVFLSTPVLT